ncbi:MAG: DUF2961 domain-containing protein [Verrucomicrobia bacterium]|nr:DUF2961 domain-containing protein [Verrucomicrobiota bacterium]
MKPTATLLGCLTLSSLIWFPISPARAAAFADDVAFVRAHTDVVVLSDRQGQAEVAVVPAWRGRVLTSTDHGANGPSFGWINRPLIAAGKLEPHINVFGGEDRLWLGPEGGQFSIFFAKDAPFDLEHWYTPPSVDTEPFQVVRERGDRIELRHRFALTNYSGTRFQVQINRAVRLLDTAETWNRLGLAPVAGVRLVGYESVNRLTNLGQQPWQKATGLLSLWILGMYNPSPTTTIVVPIHPGPESQLGRAVTSDYFGAVPPERLVVKDHVIFFSGDGKYRAKIGINPRRSRGILGSYDAANRVLTLVQFSLPNGRTDYVNSQWKLQVDPYAGDAANSYNDGPPAPGAKPLGPFFEMESSSPAAALAPGRSLTHVHRTMHLRGPEAALDAVARAELGVSLEEITRALPRPAAAADKPVITLPSLLQEMINADAVARWPKPAFTERHASSFDRRSKTPGDPQGWFANDDWSEFVRAEDHHGRREWVMLDAAGPGCVVRIWWGGLFPPKDGRIRFYLDDADEPAIEAPAYDLLVGHFLVGRPLAIENGHGPPGAPGGMNLHLPIPYARHCKITWDGPNFRATHRGEDQRWYNIEYRTYEAGTAVKTFTLEELRAARTTVERVERTLLDPPDLVDGFTLKASGYLGPSATTTADFPPGPAALRHLELHVAADDLPRALRSTVLQLTFDGEQTVWCPVGDFFGSGVGLNPMQTWYRSVDKNGTLRCRWVMPYAKSARLTVVNLGRQPVTVQAEARTGGWTWDDRSMHFHANWRYQYPIRTRPFSDWNYITINGQGLYLGDTLALFNPVRDWWGEGDEKIFVDGESFPSHFGTGSEDYYGYSWGNPTLFEGPFSAQPRCDGPGNQGHTTNTRTRNLDVIPFTKSLRFDMEIWHWRDTNVAYAATTYWYARPGATCNRQPEPDAARAPIPSM